MDKRLIIVSGPSCVGKGPIIEWVRKLYIPNLCQVKARKTKTERHKGTEDDLGFDGDNGNYHSFDCRRTEQRIYLDELDRALEEHDIVLLEIYYKAFDFLKQRYESLVDFASTFVSPLDKEELEDLVKQNKLEHHLPNLMLHHLIERVKLDGKLHTSSLMDELKVRAKDSIDEMKFAQNYRNVIPNHCYESDPRWRLSLLTGEPKRVVKSLYDIIKTGHSNYADKGSDYAFLAYR